MMKVGSTIWVISGGHIPGISNGEEPEFTSCDVLSVLNVNEKDIEINLTVYHEKAHPSGPYNIFVRARSVRKVRLNDLVNPVPLLLEEHYGIVIEAPVPIVVRFSRMHTGQAALAILSTIAYPED